MAKVKTDPQNDQSMHVFWLPRAEGGHSRVMVSVDRPAFSGMASALRVTAPGGEEIVLFAGEKVPESVDSEEPWADHPVIQVFLEPETDELRENPDVTIQDGRVQIGSGSTFEVPSEVFEHERSRRAGLNGKNSPRYPSRP